MNKSIKFSDIQKVNYIRKCKEVIENHIKLEVSRIAIANLVNNLNNNEGRGQEIVFTYERHRRQVEQIMLEAFYEALLDLSKESDKHGR